MNARTLLIGLFSLAGSAGAFGQNALGDGRSLERPLQRTGVFNAPRLDLNSEVRLRNAMVTGNAPGGRSLQIAAPYSDADDFRDALGTDSLFRFRRDSYGAGSLNVGFRGTESIQYQYAFTTGNARDAGIVTRLNSVRTLPSATGAPAEPLHRPYSAPALAPGAADAAPEIGTLRSTSTFAAVRGLSPAVVGLRQTRDGFERVTASGLLGLRSDQMVPDMKTGQLVEKTSPLSAATDTASASPTGGMTSAQTPQNLAVTQTAYDDLMSRFRQREEREAPAGTPQPTRESESPPDPTTMPVQPPADAGQTPGEIVPPPRTPGEMLRGGPDARPQIPTWESNLQSLRERLIQGGITAPAGSDDAQRRAEAANDPSTPEGRARLALAGADQALMDSIREAGGRAESYLRANPNPGDLYGEYIKEGQEMIGTRRYFDAEERFARALAMRPGDVTAMSGRLHAQLGGGLYLSAAMNLRQLYEQHPEVIGVRFGGPTIPDVERLGALKKDLGLTLDKSAQRKALPSPEAALLLAYVGFQTGDSASIERGLGALTREQNEEAALRNEPVPRADPMIAVLRGVWLGGEKGSEMQAPAPAGK